MNSDDKVWESAMSRDFDARVRHLHEAPLTLDDVKGKAGSIRRRRRAAAAGGVLAAAALIVPSVMLAGLPGGDDTGPEPVEEPTQVIDPAQVTTGWFDPETGIVHRPDGGTVELPLPEDVTVLEFTQLADGRIVTLGTRLDFDGAGNPPASAFVFDDGEPGELTEYPTAGFRLRTADVKGGQDAAGWLAPDGTPMVIVSDTADVMALPRISELGGAPEATLGGLTCGPNTEAGSPRVACRAVATTGGLGGPSYVSTTHGFTDLYSEHAVLAVSPDGDRYLAATKATDEENCVKLFRAEGGQELGLECFNGMLGPRYAFSSNGELILAGYGEGYGPYSAELLDGHTMERVATASGRDADNFVTYHQAMWGDGYVDMVVDYNQRGMEANEYELQRLHLDGTVETIRETGWIVLETP